MGTGRVPPGACRPRCRPPWLVPEPRPRLLLHQPCSSKAPADAGPAQRPSPGRWRERALRKAAVPVENKEVSKLPPPPRRQGSQGFPLSTEPGTQTRWEKGRWPMALPPAVAKPPGGAARACPGETGLGKGSAWVRGRAQAQEVAGWEAGFPTGGRWGSICMPLLCLPAPAARYACLSGNCPRAL